MGLYLRPSTINNSLQFIVIENVIPRYLHLPNNNTNLSSICQKIVKNPSIYIALALVQQPYCSRRANCICWRVERSARPRPLAGLRTVSLPSGRQRTLATRTGFDSRKRDIVLPRSVLFRRRLRLAAVVFDVLHLFIYRVEVMLLKFVFCNED